MRPARPLPVALAMVASLLSACTARASEPTATEAPSNTAPPVTTEAPSTAAPSTTIAIPASPVPSPTPSVVRTRFAGHVTPIPPALAREMRGTTWKPGCPVPISDLRLLAFNYVGFDDVVKRGQMVVNASVAPEVLWVFRQLFEARFPLKHVALATEYRPKHDDPSQHRSVTAAFNCRPAITPSGPTSTFSQHAYGLAIDVNPLQNPEVAPTGRVRDKAAKIYRDRSLHLPGMIHPGDVVVRSFAAIGWRWGGDWTSFKDYMHFSLTGR